MDKTIKSALTSKGKPAIIRNGYFFVHERDALEKKFWVCQKRRRESCRARLHTSYSLHQPELLEELGTHNHEPNPVACEIKETMARIRTDAISSSSNPAQLIANNIQGTTSAAQGAMPLAKNIKRAVRKLRNTAGGSLKIPHRREDIQLPLEFQKTETGEDFLMFDSGADKSRILIFTTHQNLQFLKFSDVWLADGTFKVAPSLFDQLFVIHGHRNHTTVPLVYCLTPNRTTATYSRILSAISNLCPNLAPATIMSDFEMASLNAFALAFPNAEKKGCYFHFNQCFFRNIQSRGEVLHSYSNDPNFSLMLRYLVALAFVPPEDVVAIFDQVMAEEFFVENEDLLLDFLTYFENTWLGPWNRNRTRRIPPRFSIELWNCYHSVLEDKPKTNNGCEGFHSGFLTLMGASHPTIYKFIRGLKDQQVLTELKINQFSAGSVSQPNRKCEDSRKKLKSVVLTYGTQDVSKMEYLRRLAYCIRP